MAAGKIVFLPDPQRKAFQIKAVTFRPTQLVCFLVEHGFPKGENPPESRRGGGGVILQLGGDTLAATGAGLGKPGSQVESA